MVLGEGRPKICVPLVSSSFEELDRECAALESQRPDMREWRVDYLLNKEDFNATADLDKAFRIIRSHFQDTPLLTTLRTKSQGGVHKTPGGDYIRLISLILASRWADIIDIEYGHEMLDTKILMARARAQKIPTLMSYHKFKRALSEMEIVDTLENMHSFHPDILKIAVVERHKNTGHIGLGYIQGYGLKSGAVATSISHDSHNIIVVGANEEDMAAAVNRVVELGGGIVVMDDGKVLGELQLQIAGNVRLHRLRIGQIFHRVAVFGAHGVVPVVLIMTGKRHVIRAERRAAVQIL